MSSSLTRSERRRLKHQLKGCIYILGEGLAYITDPAGSKYPLRCGRFPVDEHGLCGVHKTLGREEAESEN